MNAHVRVGIVRQRVVQPYVRLAQHLQPSVKRSPSAPSQPDPGGRNAASPEGPSLTPGIARFTGAKASVSTGDRPLTRAILRRHGLAVKRRAEGCGGGAGGRRRRVAGAATREGPSWGLRECGGRGWDGAGRRGGAGAGQVGGDGLLARCLWLMMVYAF